FPRQPPVDVRSPRTPVSTVVLDLYGHEAGPARSAFRYRDEVDTTIAPICCTGELDIVAHLVDALGNDMFEPLRGEISEFAGVVTQKCDELRCNIEKRDLWRILLSHEPQRRAPLVD